MSEKTYIERCPHDKKNPYTMVNRDLIRDNEISPQCRWLLIYLLSLSDDWKINIEDLWERHNKFLGRDKIRNLINEAIKHGYMRKESIRNGNKIAGVKYYVSEFKKILPRPENQAPENEAPENHTLRNSIPSKEEAYKKNISIRHDQKIETILPSCEVEKEAIEIANELWNRILSLNPKAKPPNLKKWSKTVSNAHRFDNRSWDDMKSVIKFSFEKNDFWSRTLQSAEGLRKHFDKIVSQMRPSSTEDVVSSNNLKFALKVKNILSQSNESHCLSIHKETVSFPNGESVSLNLPEKTFEDILINRFGLRRK